MSLLDNAMEDFYFMDKTKVDDGYGGYINQWVQNEKPFRAALVFDISMQARTAQAQGVKSTYTLTTSKAIVLDYHDVIKRVSDGKIFRITSDGDDKFTPQVATLDMRQVTAEEWELG